MRSKSILYSKIIPSSETPKLMLFLIRNKIARTETGALYLLMTTIAVSTALTVFLFSSPSGKLMNLPTFTGDYSLSQAQ